MSEHHARAAMQNSIFGQSVLALFYRSMGAIVTLAFGVVLARIMRIAEYGVVVSLLPFCTIAGTIAMLGQQTQLLRDVPKLLGRKDYKSIAQIASRRLELMVCGSIAVTAVGAVIFALGHGRVDMFGRWQYATSLLLITPLALIEIQNAIGCAFGSIHLAIGPREILWRLSIMLVAGAIFLITGAPPSAGVVLATAAATLWLLVALQQFWVRQIMGGRPLFSFKSLFDTRPTMRNFSSSVPFWINSVANIVCPTADIVIVSMLIGPETAAYYYAASRTALLLDFFISTFSIPAAPRIARLYETGHRAQISRMTSSAACLSAAAAMIVLVALGFFGDLILRAFGDSFVRAHGILMLLAAGQVANAYLGIGTPALEMTGHQDQAMRITVFTALFELIALMIATYEFGMWGAAVAAILSILIRKVAIASHIYMTDGIDITGTSTILEQLAALRGRLSWAAPVI